MPLTLPQSSDVLIVEDEADVREVLAMYFRERGFTVGTAADGRAAVAAIEREPTRYGLVVADLQLPGLDGLGVLRAAKERNPSIYVVIVTGYASLDSAIQAVRLGAYDYLAKPFSLGQLDVIVERLSDRFALERENRRLIRQAGERSSLDGPSTQARLEAIEARVIQVEALLRQLVSARRPA